MGWNNDYTLLTGPISAADLGRAAGYPSGKDGDNIFDVGWLIKNGAFNPMAKHKAFKSSVPGYAYDKNQSTPETRSPSRVAAAAAARYGMSGPASFNAASGDPSAWYYNRPTAGSPTEFYRVTDFDGYAQNACHPVALGVGNFAYDAESQINVFFDEKSNALRTDGKTWRTNQSLSVRELLLNYADYNIAFLIIGPNNRNLVVTGVTFRQLSENYYGNYTFKLYGTNATPPSGTPTIPVMSGSYYAQVFSIVLCALYGAGPSGGALYSVYSSDLQLYDPYSVRFLGDCDRLTNVPLRSGVSPMDSISISNLTLDATDMVTEAQYGGYTWRAYRISASAYFDASQLSWQPATLARTISGFIHITPTGAAAGFGSSPAQLGSLNDATSVAIYPQTAQMRLLFTTESNEFLWVMKANTGGVTAYAEFDYPLNNPIRVPSGTGTVSVSVTAPA